MWFFDEEEKEKFCAALRTRRLRRRQYLLQQGDVCRHDYFVTCGCLRQYEVDENGKENIIQFGFKDCRNGFFMNWFGQMQTGQEGFEYHLLVIGMCLVLILVGGGRFSADRLFS